MAEQPPITPDTLREVASKPLPKQEADQAPEPVTSVQLVEQWRDGSQEAANVLHERYLAKLVDLARRHLNEKFSSRVDPEDLVQSIFRSVFRVTRQRSIHFSDDTGFWKWLATVALNKTFKRVQFMDAMSRTPGRESRMANQPAATPVTRAMPTAAEVVEFADLLEMILGSLEPLDQQILQLRLEGYTQLEIANQVLLDARTVRRRMVRIRECVAGTLEGETPPELV